ncbi:MAG: cytochrome B6, partial [Candidatus Hydrogenedentes bacterium]|nr:cytochrome B6 [Candidatus Hydrogenedentota bacterium]
FKVPLLRNIALTAPYLHDSSTDDLQKVVNIMLKYQVGIQVPKSDEEKIVKFLRTLNGEYKGKLLQ